MDENELSKIIIGSAIKVHQSLGPGLLENAYQECLFYELKNQNLNVLKENPCLLCMRKSKWIVGTK